MTNRAVELVKRFEGCSLTAYPDAGGIWTIGWGHTPAVEGQVISQAKADALLEQDLSRAASYVGAYTRVPLTASMYDALTSFVYNVGAGNLARSALLKKLNAGQYLDVPGELLLWRRAGGKVLLGLVRRRIAEAALFVEDGLPAKEVMVA